MIWSKSSQGVIIFFVQIELSTSVQLVEIAADALIAVNLLNLQL